MLTTTIPETWKFRFPWYVDNLFARWPMFVWTLSV